MPKRTKESRSSNRHSGSHFSPKRSTRGPDYPMGPSRATRSDSHNSGRMSPHSMSGGVKQANGSLRHQMHADSPILIEDDDDYKNVDSSVFRDNGSNLKPDIGESTQIVKHFVASADSRHHVTSVPEKPMFRGPETDVLHDLVKDKLKIIRVQMIRADVPQSDTYHKSYTIEDDASRTKGDNHQHYDDRQTHFNPTTSHYDHDTKYGLSPHRVSRDRSLSPRRGSRPPSPPLPYSSNIDHYAETNTHRDSRSKRSSDRNVHDRNSKKHNKFDDFASGPPPEPRSPSNSHFRSSDHPRRRSKDKLVRYDNRQRHGDNSSPPYLENRYPPFRSPSPNNRPFSPPNERPSRRVPFSPPPPRELSPPLNDQTPDERARRRRSPVSKRDRSRERRRRSSPKRKTPPTARSPRRREIDHRRKRSTSRNRERKREGRERRRRSRSKSNSPQQDQEDYSPSQNQPVYPAPPHGVRLPPPRPYLGPMMMPLRPPPPYPPPMGAWRTPRPPMQGPPPPGGAWPYPRPRPFYFPY
ncbi:serine/arginine repetitive matrix protein 1-like [Adelges cooleyi]|uniref:serine/arginine repetitive matrix protein 1-like n=1 Tax=Adelges cooleyi TaxID=133065 RepID=UPI0021800C00|nr:serine/arginine repetitive matrix protein 1-like [Adelges cooleyi]XP_050440487.1 serine/arginine repetitive matrix protein 1-like [Adelges cooleyi]XP_050440488.1 serine/arginine repetitive matrix protein 1-like [Adelges cooleyi]